jgi:RNA polymerase sigma factor (sigma-70 family)
LESFERLLVQYQPMIHKIIRTLSIYKNFEEFYQIGLIALWDASNRYDPSKGNFKSYAYSFISGRILTELSKMNKNEERNIHPEEEYWDHVKDDRRTDLEDELDIGALCESLTVNQKKWLMYAYFDTLSIKEIAERENVSLSAVKSWRCGARVKLIANKKQWDS